MRQEKGKCANIMCGENPVTKYSEREWSRSKTVAGLPCKNKEGSPCKDLGGKSDYGRPYLLG